MEEISINKLSDNFIETIGKEWMLVTAGTKEKFNTMTASWGGIGFLWNKPVAFVFIRPERYTHQFIEQEDLLTLSFLGEKGKEIHKVCGSKSGRDTDKIKETGLTPIEIKEGAMGFEQSRLTLVCRKMYTDMMRPEAFLDKEALERWYNDKPGGSFHQMYIVEIEKAIVK